MKRNKSAALSLMAGACFLAALVSQMGPVAAQTTGGTPEVAPPTGPAPRLPSARFAGQLCGGPGLSGGWPFGWQTSLPTVMVGA